MQTCCSVLKLFYLGHHISNLFFISVILVKFQRNYKEQLPNSAIIFKQATVILLSVNFKQAG